jgi:hypothetical protein
MVPISMDSDKSLPSQCPDFLIYKMLIWMSIGIIT